MTYLRSMESPRYARFRVRGNSDTLAWIVEEGDNAHYRSRAVGLPR
jgi:hypothetical protein